jgi:hypothetical protein
LVDTRYERIWFPNHTTQDRFEVVAFPFQWAKANQVLGSLFAGGTYTRTSSKDTGGVVAGAIGKLGFLNIAVSAEYQFHPADTIVTLGVIDWF